MGLVIVAVGLAGLQLVLVMREDAAVVRAAVEGYEEATGRNDVEVERFGRWGSCAAANVFWPHGAAFVALHRDNGEWTVKGLITEYADVDDVSDGEYCQDALRAADPLPR